VIRADRRLACRGGLPLEEERSGANPGRTARRATRGRLEPMMTPLSRLRYVVAVREPRSVRAARGPGGGPARSGRVPARAVVAASCPARGVREPSELRINAAALVDRPESARPTLAPRPGAPPGAQRRRRAREPEAETESRPESRTPRRAAAACARGARARRASRPTMDFEVRALGAGRLGAPRTLQNARIPGSRSLADYRGLRYLRVFFFGVEFRAHPGTVCVPRSRSTTFMLASSFTFPKTQ